MKKATIVVCALIISVSMGLVACGTPQEPPAPVESISSEPLAPESQPESSAVVSEPPQSQVSSSVSSAVVSNPDDVFSGYSYSMKRVPFQWQHGAGSYQVNYLRVLGDRDGAYSKVNVLLKERAMRMADSFGYQPRYDAETGEELPVKLTTTSELAFRNEQFISVIIRTEYAVGDDEPVSVLDTVNCYLDEGNTLSPEESEVTMQNSLDIKEELAQVLVEAVRDQGTPELQEYLTAERILAQLYQNPMFFTEKYMAISLRLPHALGDHVELKLNYPELAPFMKMNTVWRMFI